MSLTGHPPEKDRNVVVVGSSGAIGRAFCEFFQAQNHYNVIPMSRSGSEIVLDVTDETTIKLAAAQAASVGEIDLLINCVGLLHDECGVAPEKSLKYLNAKSLEKYFCVNTIGTALLLKHFTPLMPRGRRSVFASLSARVGSLGDNRLGGWYGYRASKAAHNMILKNSAIELARTHPLAVCAALHPGTVESPLSAPYAKANDTFSPQESVSRMVSVIQSLEPRHSGGVFAYDGSSIPW